MKRKLTDTQLEDLLTVGRQQAMVKEAKKAKERLAGFIEENLCDLLDGIEVKGVGNVRIVLKRELHVGIPPEDAAA